MSSCSSDEIEVEYEKREKLETNWEKLKLYPNPMLFKTCTGQPISFHIKTDKPTLKKNYEDIVVIYGGRKIEDYINMDNNTALMVQDESKSFFKERPTFKMSYIIDSIEKNKLLDISYYLHNFVYFKKRDYMRIIYQHEEEFVNKCNMQQYFGSSDETEAQDQDKKTNKLTRKLYTRSEKEAILKFILVKKKLDGLRGNRIWKQMERKAICPCRTYQSMKNHFLKTLLFELDKFDFLTESDREKMRKSQ